MNRLLTNLIALGGALASTAAYAEVSLSLRPLALDLSTDPLQTPATPEPPSPPTATDAAAPRTTYGRAGSQAWTIGALYANDFHQADDLNIHGAYSIFLADEFEFAIEAALWWFDQPGKDTGGVSGSMLFRWHFLHAEDYDWTVFGDGGIGLLAGFDQVPDGGTGFNFLPRLGAGFTKRLGDDPNDPRLMVGVRWHHISNARIEGDDRNPGRDSLAVYAAIVIPF